MRSGITRRWLRGNLLLTVLLLVLVEGMFLYSYTRSYYNGVQQTMVRRFSSITGQLKMYTGDTAQKASASRSVALRRMVEQFSDKDKYEFMLLDSYGGVIASSSGTDADGIVTQSDFEQAQDAVDGMGVALYKTQSGEQVMSVCYLVPYAAEDVAAMRLVTSMTLVTRQLKNAIAVSAVIDKNEENAAAFSKIADSVRSTDDIVGANALALGSFIKGYDGKARRGQQPEQPAVGTPQLGDGLYRQMERGADAAAQQADGQGQHQPAQQHPGHLPGGAGSAGERFAHKIHILTGKIFAVPL